MARLRSSYAQKGDNSNSDSLPIRSTERLEVESKGQESAPDVIGPRQPDVTTPVDELVLDEILMDIARREIRCVGITATDALDVIFLAQRVRQFVPDARLFTTQNNLVFVHSKTIADLRGMIVASSYPLAAENQAWSYSYHGDDTRVFFSSDDAQGVYNATVAHLYRLGVRTSPARFLEYGQPFDGPWNPASSAGGRPVHPRKPPVWISVIGNHGIYPLRAAWGPEPDRPDTADASRKLWLTDNDYVLTYDQTEDDFDAMHFEGADDRVLKWFRPSFRSFWMLVYVGLSLFNIMLGCLALWHLGLALGPRHADGSCKRQGGWSWFDWPATYLNCQQAPGSSHSGLYLGPGPHLVLKLLLALIIFWEASRPLREVMIVPWLPVNSDYYEFWFLGITALARGALVVGLIAAIIAAIADRAVVWALPDVRQELVVKCLRSAFLGNGSRAWKARRIVRVLLLLLASAAMIGIAGYTLWRAGRSAGDIEPRWPLDQIARTWKSISRDQVDRLLRFDRSMALPSGVSFLIPLLFLSATATSWVFLHLHRRYLLEQVTSPGLDSGNHTPAADRDFAEATWDKTIELRHKFQCGLSSAAKRLVQVNPIGVLLSLGIAFYFLRHVLDDVTRPGPFERVVDGLFCVFFVALLFHWLQLLLLWSELHQLLGQAAQLPLLRAMDRLPPRVARWFYEVPRPGAGRFALVQQQARALAAASSPPSRASQAQGKAGTTTADNPLLVELEAVYQQSGDPAAWAKIRATWPQLQEELRTIGQQNMVTTLAAIRPVLLTCWRNEPVASVIADASDQSAGKASSGDVSAMRTIAVALVDHKVPPEEPKRLLPGWVREAEDLFGLVMVRWLAAGLAQLWVVVGFLVIGSATLLLAVSSYPFPLQSHMFAGLGVLIVLIAAAVAWVLLGINRNELISRVANSAPNKFKIDGQLVSSLMTYVVPLLGVLAAVSFDASDTLRAILDPILRHLH